MKFFKSKKKVTTRDFRVKTEDPTAALKKELDSAIVPSLKAKTSDEISESKKTVKKAEPVKKAAAEPVAEVEAPAVEAEPTAEAVEKTSGMNNVRLFPGFEDQRFEVGYAAYSSDKLGFAEKTPMLLVRWKLSPEGETDWFPLPPMFNKAILARIHERDTDLDRLLLDYGYDADQLCRPSSAG